jgi:urease accessory protein
MKMSSMAWMILGVGLAMPGVALAHVGVDHGYGFGAGLGHPVGGLDHLLAMLAVGLWAAQLGGRARWALPATFVGVMVLGGLMGLSGGALALMEPMIVWSVPLLGLFLLGAWRLPVVVAAVAVGAFAWFHGYAHGAEMPASGHALGYMIGFAVSTAALHGAGFAAGWLAARLQQGQVTRYAGLALVVAGLALVVG